MTKTLIKCAVVIICTVAVCLTFALATPKSAQTKSDYPAYMTATQAAEYIGVSEEILDIMRKDLKYLNGAYISYTYTDADGKEITELVYSKAALDEAIEALMDKNDALNFKYIQEVRKNSANK